MLPIGGLLSGAARAAASVGGKALSGLGRFLGIGGTVAKAGGGGIISRAAGAVGNFLRSPFGGTVAGFGVGSALFGGGGGGGGGGAGDPENVQAATADVIGTLLDGGSDSMVRSAWRVARAMGATQQSLFFLIRELDAGPADKIAISSELERILRVQRRRRSVVPKSITKALKIMGAVRRMVSPSMPRVKSKVRR